MNEKLKLFIHWAIRAETHASTKYTIYASLADELKEPEISKLFKTLAENEKEHAEVWMKKLFDIEKWDIKDFVKDGIKGELSDETELYSDIFRQISDKDKREDISTLLSHLSTIEKDHKESFEKALSILEGNKNFDISVEKEVWVCPHCGNIYHSYSDIPDKCPVCEHDKKDYKLRTKLA